MTRLLALNKRPQNHIRVNFSNRGFRKVVRSVRSFDENVPNRNSIVDVADILSDLAFKKDKPFGYKSIPEFVGIDYVGYVVEKERLDQKTGYWVRIDEYKIIGTEAINFKDSRVAYGNQYRYRIRSVLKITTPVLKEGYENFDLVQDLKRFERKMIKGRLQTVRGLLSRVDRVTNRGLHSKLSQGKKITTLDIIKGIKIEADSRKIQSLKVPVSDQRSQIRDMRLLKNLKSRSQALMKGTISKQHLQKEINKRLKAFKERYVEYKSFYYESEPSKNWIYVNIFERVPPPPPSAIKITPNSPRKEIFVTWLKPANSQRDIKYFKVYKKRRIKEKWILLTTLPENENIYTDRDVKLDDKWIYALTCVDAHEIESFMSTQIQAGLNPNFAREKEEKKLKWISGSGAEPEETNIVIKKFFDQEKPIVAKKSITLIPSTDFSEAVKNLVVRITSLDTHELKELKVNVKNLNIRDVYREE